MQAALPGTLRYMRHCTQHCKLVRDTATYLFAPTYSCSKRAMEAKVKGNSVIWQPVRVSSCRLDGSALMLRRFNLLPVRSKLVTEVALAFPENKQRIVLVSRRAKMGFFGETRLGESLGAANCQGRQPMMEHGRGVRKLTA